VCVIKSANGKVPLCISDVSLYLLILMFTYSIEKFFRLHFVLPIFTALFWTKRALNFAKYGNTSVYCILTKLDRKKQTNYFCKFLGTHSGAVDVFVFLGGGATSLDDCPQTWRHISQDEGIMYDFVCISLSTNDIEKYSK
jgi:hypothetical protein